MPDVANQVSYEQRVLAADPNATGIAIKGLTGTRADAREHLPGSGPMTCCPRNPRPRTDDNDASS